MTAVRAIVAFLQGAQTDRRRAAARLAGTPFMLRLHYLSGHPGIWSPEPFLVGRVGNRIRLVDQTGDRTYDLPLERIASLSLAGHDRLSIQFEPTAGFLTNLEFQAEEGAARGYAELHRLIARG